MTADIPGLKQKFNPVMLRPQPLFWRDRRDRQNRH